MRDLAILLAAAFSFEGLRRWHHWYMPIVLLAVVQIFERPQPERRPLAVGSLKQWQVGWGRRMSPASRPSTRVAHS